MMPCLIRLLEPDVGVPRALGAEIAHRREAREQVSRADSSRAQREKSTARGDLIVPWRFVVRMEQEVRMPFDHAGDQGRAGQCNGICIDRSVHIRRGSDGVDLLTANEYDPTVVQLRKHRRNSAGLSR